MDPLQPSTLVLEAGAPGSIERAVAVLRRGGLVAFPTDTVYGVGALAWSQEAVSSLYWAKHRSAEKAIPLLLAGPEQLASVAGDLSPLAQRLAVRFWPGPLTLVVPCRVELPPAVTGGGDTVAVRVPDHQVILLLLRRLGSPLAATSANLSGCPSPRTAQDVLSQLDGRIDLVLDGGACPGGVPSTVVDVTGGQLSILRAGPISLTMLEQLE